MYQNQQPAPIVVPVSFDVFAAVIETKSTYDRATDSMKDSRSVIREPERVIAFHLVDREPRPVPILIARGRAMDGWSGNSMKLSVFLGDTPADAMAKARRSLFGTVSVAIVHQERKSA